MVVGIHPAPGEGCRLALHWPSFLPEEVAAGLAGALLRCGNSLVPLPPGTAPWEPGHCHFPASGGGPGPGGFLEEVASLRPPPAPGRFPVLSYWPDVHSEDQQR